MTFPHRQFNPIKNQNQISSNPEHLNGSQTHSATKSHVNNNKSHNTISNLQKSSQSQANSSTKKSVCACLFGNLFRFPLN